MRLLSRFRSLAPADRQLFVETAFLLAAIRLALALVSFKTLQDLLMRCSRPGARRSDMSAPLPAARVSWAIRTASRYVPQTQNCLIQALAAWTVLSARRHPAVLRIGVSNGADQGFKAHAWVEYDGTVVIGGLPELASYTPLVLRGTTSQ